MEPLTWLILVCAVLITGISKSGFGGGLGGVAVPLLALNMDPAQAAGIMLPILCLMDLAVLWRYRGHWHLGHLRALLLPAMLGMALGAVMFTHFEADTLRLILGVICVLFSLNEWAKTRRQAPAWQPGPLSAAVCGTAAGLTTFVAHSGGPPVNIYMLPLKLPRTVFVATTGTFFATVNYVKLVPYYFLDLLSAPNLTISALMLPVVALGIGAGFWLHSRISDVLFYRVAYTLNFLVGLWLIYDGLT